MDPALPPGAQFETTAKAHPEPWVGADGTGAVASLVQLEGEPG